MASPVMDDVIPNGDASRGPTGSPEEGKGIPLFRARAKAKEFRAQLDELRDRVEHLGLLSTIELEQRKAALLKETSDMAAKLAHDRSEAVATVERAAASTRETAERNVAELTARAGAYCSSG